MVHAFMPLLDPWGLHWVLEDLLGSWGGRSYIRPDVNEVHVRGRAQVSGVGTNVNGEGWMDGSFFGLMVVGSPVLGSFWGLGGCSRSSTPMAPRRPDACAGTADGQVGMKS